MDLKTTRLAIEVKDADLGLVAAKFSTYDVIDSDGDVTRRGAFTDGQEVRISAWNHGSWGDALPVGKGTIHDAGDGAVLEGQFFLATAAGREHFEVVKALGGLQEWSYGYRVTASSHGEHEGQEVRFLEGLDVTEVAPVLKGAGIGTRTLTVKADDSALAALLNHATGVTTANIALTFKAQQEPVQPEAPSEDEAERKRRQQDLLRLVAAAHDIPTGGTS